MIVNKITEAVIYETPDGGQTVYVRKPGEAQRQLHSESDDVKTLRQKVQEEQMWCDIRRAAKPQRRVDYMTASMIGCRGI